MKNELQKWTNLSQAKNGVVDSFDVFSSKSLDMSIDRSKDVFAGLEPKNSNVACDSNEMLGTINARDLEIKMLGQSVTTLKAQNFLLET